MAIKIYEQFAPFANPADGDYPQGSFKNDSIPGAEDGTPLDAVWANDYAGSDAELFARAGVVPSGQPDKLGASQRVDAINVLISTSTSDLRAAKFEQYQQASKVSQVLADGEHFSNSPAFTIDCYGDSTMWGAIPGNTTQQDPENSPVSLKKAIDLIFKTNLVTVRNLGRSGTTLKQLINGTDGGTGTLSERLLASPDTTLVYCNHCLNDCGSYESNLEQYHQNLVTFVNTVRGFGKIPVLVTPTLMAPVVAGREDQTKRQRSFIQAMIDVANTMSVDLVDNFKFSLSSARLFPPATIAPDGVHLSRLFYQQAGRNMAIPLLRPAVLRNVNDIASFSCSSYSDSITNGRAMRTELASEFSAVLSGDAIPTAQAINIPVVLENPTDDTVLAVGGGLTEVGAIGKLTYFGSATSDRFDGNIDYKAKVGTTRYDCLFQPSFCAIPAGLAIVGVEVSTATSPAPNVNFTMSGAKLLPRVQASFGYLGNSGFQLSRPILVGDEVNVNMFISADSTILELKSTTNPFSTVALLKWDAGLNKITLTTDSGVVDVWSGPSASQQYCSLSIQRNRTIMARVGGLAATSAQLSHNVGKLFVANAINYVVKKY